MEIKGYNYNYLENAMNTLGDAFSYAVDHCKISLDNFMDFFVFSGYAKQFEDGNPSIILGCSGIELVLKVMDKVNLKVEDIKSEVNFIISKEYWCGWILAYYQWKTGLSFKYIHSMVSMMEIEKMYSPLHEASEEKFVDVLNKIIKSRIDNTRLKQLRKARGMTQKELAEKAGVNLRTLQQYELGEKDINKASVLKVYNLARVLNCNIEDLLEII